MKRFECTAGNTLHTNAAMRYVNICMPSARLFKDFKMLIQALKGFQSTVVLILSCWLVCNVMEAQIHCDTNINADIKR